MALIKCPECEREVSDQAQSCPNCGYPLRKQPPPVPPTGEVQTVEATGKMWKALQLIGVVLVCIGVVSCMVSYYSVAPTELGAGPVSISSALFFLAGLACMVVGRVGAWWYHD